MARNNAIKNKLSSIVSAHALLRFKVLPDAQKKQKEAEIRKFIKNCDDLDENEKESIENELLVHTDTQLNATVAEFNSLLEKSVLKEYGLKLYPESSPDDTLGRIDIVMGTFEYSKKETAKVEELKQLCHQFKAVKGIRDTLRQQHKSYGHKMLFVTQKSQSFQRSLNIKPRSSISQFFKNIKRALSRLTSKERKKAQ